MFTDPVSLCRFWLFHTFYYLCVKIRIMTTTKPDVNPDGLYNQKQAAEALSVSRQTIRRYTASGTIKFESRNAGGTKVTTGERIVRCWRLMSDKKE